MNISDYDYHIRMLADLAVQNKGAIVLGYDGGTTKKNYHITIGGKVTMIFALATSLIEDVAENLHVPVEELLEMMSKQLKMKQEENDDE